MAYKKNKLVKFVPVIFSILLLSVLLTSCVCPIFSFIEKRTGVDVATGEDIDTGFIGVDLKYPGSVLLMEVTGDVEKIVNTASNFGVSIGQEEAAVIASLPQEVREEEVTAVIYYTGDSMEDIWSYYSNLEEKGWSTSSYQSGSVTGGDSVAFFMFKDDIKQPVLINSAGDRRFIIFIDYDWDSL